MGHDRQSADVQGGVGGVIHDHKIGDVMDQGLLAAQVLQSIGATGGPFGHELPPGRGEFTWWFETPARSPRLN
jgi:hypothetical protein